MVELLLRLGADVNHRDRVNGWTALMQASSCPLSGTETDVLQATFYSHSAVITSLLEAGADPGLTDQHGCTALDLATLVEQQDCGLVRLLATHTMEARPPSLQWRGPQQTSPGRHDTHNIEVSWAARLEMLNFSPLKAGGRGV